MINLGFFLRFFVHWAPVSLTCVVCKIMESVICDYVTGRMMHSGFCPHFSTVLKKGGLA